MFGLGRNAWILAVTQPFALAISPATVFLSGFVGKTLAPDPSLATLPLSFLVIGLAMGAVPGAMAMERFGRKPVFLAAMLVCAIASLIATTAITIESFSLLLVANLFAGATLAVVQQFRFAAIESASDPAFASRAMSVLMLGSVLAAFIGTEAAATGKFLLTTEFSGSYVILAGVSLIAFLTLLFYRDSKFVSKQEENKGDFEWKQVLGRPNLLLAVAAATIGYGVMTFVMTATPLAMHDFHHHSLDDTKWVIQSHIMAMYLPSLITGELIRKLGVKVIITCGVLAYVVTTIFALSGAEVFHYWWALVALGIGWNFLFIGGTTLLTQTYKENEKFKLQAANDFAVFVFQAGASLMAGAILFNFGWQAIIYTATLPSIILLIALTVNWIKQRKLVSKPA